MTKKQEDELVKVLKEVKDVLLRLQPQVIYVYPPVAPAPPYVPPFYTPNLPIITCGGVNTAEGYKGDMQVHS